MSGKSGSSKDPEGFKREAESLLDYVANNLKQRRANHGGVRRESLLAREELKDLGIAPTHLIVEIMQEALSAYKTGKDEGDYTRFEALGIAMDGAKTLAKYTYPTMKAVQISMDEGKKSFDANNPKQLLEVAINDPFLSDEAKEELITKLQSKKKIYDHSILPMGKPQKDEE